ncbi:DMT family transporter [Pelagicoccus sp. SDUM812005]|uniref:DMT family transporter n=1 Tax=Pelagicoccus sp. SDUM812005 TaxID=3041257 RepID=UPI00281066A8|nr:DMT family transporter [Pelagicoccus sp. SDUM812005]MDQ8181669.1 DMT family transporter [Pelagicoccus sp. SDUM812005]
MKPLSFSFYLQVLVCAALWGSAFPVIKLSYEALAIDGFQEQMVFAGLRFTLAGLLIVPFCRSSVVETVRTAPRGLLIWVILGQTVLQYVFFYYALSVSSGTLGALLGSSGSFWWMLLAPLLLRTALPSGWQWAMIGLCSLGIGLAVYAPGAGSGQVGLGALCFLLASLSGAFGAIGLKKLSAFHGSRAITAISLFAGGLCLLLVGLEGWDGFWRDLSGKALWALLYLAFLSATAFTLWNRLIEQYSVNVLSAYRFLIPLCGVIESSLLVEGETIGLGIVLGGTLILGALYGMSRLERRAA